MDAKRERNPHVYRNTVEFHWRNGNQRRLYHSKFYGSGSGKPHTDSNRNGNAYANSDSYTYCDPYAYTHCHPDSNASIERINLQWGDAVC